MRTYELPKQVILELPDGGRVSARVGSIRPTGISCVLERPLPPSLRLDVRVTFPAEGGSIGLAADLVSTGGNPAEVVFGPSRDVLVRALLDAWARGEPATLGIGRRSPSRESTTADLGRRRRSRPPTLAPVDHRWRPVVHLGS